MDEPLFAGHDIAAVAVHDRALMLASDRTTRRDEMAPPPRGSGQKSGECWTTARSRRSAEEYARAPKGLSKNQIQ